MNKENVNILAKEQPKKVVLADGNEYVFPLINLTTLANLEQTLGVSLTKLGEEMESKAIQTMRLFVFGLLKENYPDLTLEKAGELVTMKEINEVSNIISSIMNA